MARLTRISAAAGEDGLEVRFREVGLAPGERVTLLVHAYVAAEWWAGRAGREVLMTEVSASGEFTAGPEGEASGLLRLSPPPADPAARQGRVIYSEIQLVDETSNIVTEIPGTFTVQPEPHGSVSECASDPQMAEVLLPVTVTASVTCGKPVILGWGAQSVSSSLPSGGPCGGSVTRQLRVAIPVQVTVRSE